MIGMLVSGTRGLGGSHKSGWTILAVIDLHPGRTKSVDRG